MIPTPEVSRRTLTAWLLRHTRGLLPALAAATLARIVGRLLNMAILVIAIRAVLDAPTGSGARLLPLALLVVGLSLAKAGLRYLEHYAGHWVAFTALQRLRELFFTRLAPQAPAATTGHASAEVTERATRDIDRIEVFFAHTFPPVVASVVVPALALSWLAAAVDARLAGIIALFLGAALLLPFVSARATWTASRKIAAHRGRVAAHVADDVQGLREVLAFEAQGLRAASLDDLESGLIWARQRLGRVVALRLVGERALWIGCIVALLLAGAPAGATATALALMLALWFGSAGTDDFATGLDAAFAACARVHRVIEARPAVLDTGTGSPAGTGGLAVQLHRVRFAYPGADTPALVDVDARFDAGGWHYVAGVSGSGKSTIASLVIRAWDADSGAILVHGTPLPDLSLEALRTAVAVVDQRPTLFAGTLARNLRLARPDATDDQLFEALSLARLDANALPKGLDTPVGERGTTLSGGQLQRIALARALVADPRVLVLDEGLSQLDAPTAAEVRAGLAGRLDRCTVIEVTHRVDVIPDDGHVVVIDRGRVVEDGTAGALRADGGAFATLALRGSA